MSIGFVEIMMGLLCVLMILVITAIAQPPNKWVEWLSRRQEKKNPKR